MKFTISSRMPAALMIHLAVIATAGQSHAELLNRKIAALYNGKEDHAVEATRIHRHLEVVLNHYGFIVDYYDAAEGLPDDRTMSGYIGIVTWFRGDRMPRASEYCSWLARQIRQGRRAIILDNFGAFEDSDTRAGRVPDDRINEALGELGFRHGFSWSGQSYAVGIEAADTEMAAFERPLVFDYRPFEWVTAVRPESRVYLKLRRKNPMGEDWLSDAIAVTDRGGMAIQGYVYYRDDETGKFLWRLNPFRFIREALGLGVIVAPDATTENGRRIFYSHIDGDGFNNRAFHGLRETSSKIIHVQILKKYPLPVSVSVITADIMPEYLGSAENVRRARDIFRLPNVEPASHTFTHPLIWENLDRTGGAVRKKMRTELGHRYVEQSSDILRDVQKVNRSYRMTNENEIKSSIDYINGALVPPDKKARLLLWSGDCLPDTAAMEVIQKYGLINLNGGESRFDPLFPSYMNLYPFRRQIGRPGQHYQYYTSNQNENRYTNLWTGPFHAYGFVISTFLNTEQPVRIRPVNVYYHFYSAERPASLRALKAVHDWVMTQDVFPMFASDYVEVVEGFFSTRLERNGPEDFTIRDNGACRTIRFETLPPDEAPDLIRSTNILGYRFDRGVLYVHLDEHPNHRVVLIRAAAPPPIPYLIESSAGVSDWRVTKTRIAFRADIKGQGRFRIAAPLTGPYRATWHSEGGQPETTRLMASNGELSFRKDIFGRVDVEIVREEK